ncbi:MAG: insulinase family protein [Proteobacteria bacterium]|nr:insulinase family protein [Pseudomonadota bacterium]
MRHEAKKHLYPNGLTLIVDEAPELRSIAIGAWVKTGTRNEDPESAGMCHFLEHMIFKGSERRSSTDISKAVDRVGGDFNAFTSREHTCFHFYLPHQEIALGASLLKEVLFKPLFAKKEIEREQQVVIQEIAMTRENPEEDSFDRFFEKIFGKHPLGRNILGTVESVQSLNREKVLAFFHRQYRPENMVIALSGAIGFERAKREFAQIGESPWPGRGVSRGLSPAWGVDPPEHTVPGLWWVDQDSEQAHVIYGLHTPLKNRKERIISTLIQQHLGGGMSSVLFDEIREKKGWAYTVYANAIPFLDTAVFSLYAGVRNDKVLETIRVFHSEMARIAREGIPQADLKRIKDSLIYSFELSLESSESRMMTISNSELFFKRGLTLKNYHQAVSKIRVSETAKAAQEWIRNSPPSILVLGRKPRSRALQARIREESMRITGVPPSFEI